MGKTRGPSVVAYRTKYGCYKDNVVFDPSRRTHFERDVPMEGAEGKEVMVVVTRGEVVDCEVRADAPLLEEDVRRDYPGMTWSEIRKTLIHAVIS